ncbi:MAG: STAS domain-containing protein [Candidatus Omnitrophota bacterium]
MIKFIADLFKDRKGKILPYIKEIKRLERLTIIRFHGFMDSSTIPIINENIGSYTRDALDRNILLDFKDVTNVDSSTVASIILLLNNVQKSDRKLGLINVTNQLINFLRVERIETLIKIYKSEEEGLKDLS